MRSSIPVPMRDGNNHVVLHTLPHPRPLLQEEASFNAFYTLRMARADAKFVGVREKRAKAKAEAEEQAAKKAAK